MVEVQDTTETSALFYGGIERCNNWRRLQQLIIEALMIPFVMIMGEVLLDRIIQ